MTKSGGCQRSDITELTAVILTVILAEELSMGGSNGVLQDYIELWEILSWKEPTRLIKAWAYSWRLKCTDAEFGHLRGIRE